MANSKTLEGGMEKLQKKIYETKQTISDVAGIVSHWSVVWSILWWLAIILGVSSPTANTNSRMPLIFLLLLKTATEYLTALLLDHQWLLMGGAVPVSILLYLRDYCWMLFLLLSAVVIIFVRLRHIDPRVELRSAVSVVERLNKETSDFAHRIEEKLENIMAQQQQQQQQQIRNKQETEEEDEEYRRKLRHEKEDLPSRDENRMDKCNNNNNNITTEGVRRAAGMVVDCVLGKGRMALNYLQILDMAVLASSSSSKCNIHNDDDDDDDYDPSDDESSDDDSSDEDPDSCSPILGSGTLSILEHTDDTHRSHTDAYTTTTYQPQLPQQQKQLLCTTRTSPSHDPSSSPSTPHSPFHTHTPPRFSPHPPSRRPVSPAAGCWASHRAQHKSLLTGGVCAEEEEDRRMGRRRRRLPNERNVYNSATEVIHSMRDHLDMPTDTMTDTHTDIHSSSGRSSVYTNVHTGDTAYTPSTDEYVQRTGAAAAAMHTGEGGGGMYVDTESSPCHTWTSSSYPTSTNTHSTPNIHTTFDPTATTTTATQLYHRYSEEENSPAGATGFDSTTDTHTHTPPTPSWWAVLWPRFTRPAVSAECCAEDTTVCWAKEEEEEREEQEVTEDSDEEED
eukprot:GHVQ01029322.1.p1 GENE.GHVQ01029322.1~~GHVQ01029322.1.p1  ORF type:complete len:701 (+),score=192.82 GHVQ01029322.1:248-2104(+)